MPTTNRSPYAATFRTAVRNGTPASKAVAAIAKHHNTTTNAIYTSLYKAGVCTRQKYNGQYVYWPTDGTKANPKNAKNCQAEIWQQVIDWCIVSGQYKPQQITNYADNQTHFVSFCNRAINAFNQKATTKRTATKRTTARTGARKRTAKPATRAHTRTHSARKTTHYQFPQTAATRRYRRAA